MVSVAKAQHRKFFVPSILSLDALRYGAFNSLGLLDSVSFSGEAHNCIGNSKTKESLLQWTYIVIH
jgi:hypothetical protein